MLKRYEIVLSIYPTRRGIAFVLFSGANNPTHWGHTRRGKKRDDGQCLKRVRWLLAQQPDVLVLQDTSWTGTRRSPRAIKLNDAIFELADEHGLTTCTFSREHVRLAFGHLANPTRYSIAQHIAKNIPVLEHHLPPPRKRWLPESDRMGIFDAAALALTFFQRVEKREQTAA